MTAAGPTLDRLHILDNDGRRNTVHPADIEVGKGHGVRLQWRRRFFYVLIGFFLVVPWLERDGEPLIRLDIPRRSFHILGLAFNAQDGPLLFLLFSGMGFSLIVASTLIGRLWCGWACPQTVLLEGLFRRVERLVDGAASSRVTLEHGPWTFNKLWRRAAKWSAWVVVALVLVHTFLAYFVGGRALVAFMTEGPLHHPYMAGVALCGTALVLFDMAWFREQLCLIVCPYGRLQSVLADEDTFAIGYDVKRGEPRGKASDAHAGACVDCHRCVVVCPTGIDIRNGLQLDCIGCGQCADACDDVMDKLHRPRGLVRTDSLRGMRGEKRRVVRPRLLAYGVAGLVGVVVAGTFIARRQSVEANIMRAPGAPFVIGADGRVTNPFMLHLVNKLGTPIDVALQIEAPAAVTATLPAGHVVPLAAEEHRTIPLVLSFERGAVQSGTAFEVELSTGGRERELSSVLLGPSP